MLRCLVNSREYRGKFQDTELQYNPTNSFNPTPLYLFELFRSQVSYRTEERGVREAPG